MSAPLHAGDASRLGGLSDLPSDYAGRVYAGVLGKVIGVYLGRPIEGKTYEQIAARLGDVDYYVHDAMGVPLVVPDDDITGTFTFVRAMEDHGDDPAIRAEQIGQSWLDYLVEGRTILWWGGLGNSTEHTAYLRLKAGIPAPRSGSIEVNGQVVAEQIGAQIFIDGWAMLHPGDPGAAADLAQRAASVSHDGAAVHAAQVLAAMEAQAFVETDIGRLLEVGVSVIPADSIIRRLIDDLREWHAVEADWRAARRRIVDRYGYDRYGGNVHVVPNHALIVMSMLYGEGDFGRTLKIVNTCGWDTDCNSGNVGCLMGIRGGLAGVDHGRDWRGPVADRLFLPTADPDRAISDAVRETDLIVGIARRMRKLEDVRPKGGARFHFEQPGSVQGFMADSASELPADAGAARLTLENVVGHSQAGARSLALTYEGLGSGRSTRAMTPTFFPADTGQFGTYALLGSPTLYPGQTISVRCESDTRNPVPVAVGLVIRHAGPDDRRTLRRGPFKTMNPGDVATIDWQVPDLGGQPVVDVGLELGATSADDVAQVSGAVYLDYMTWAGAPNVRLGRPVDGGTEWRRAWVNGVDDWPDRGEEPFRIIQNRGTGALIQGTRDWRDYGVEADLRVHMAIAGGLAVRVRGLTRWLALMVGGSGTVSLIRSSFDHRVVLAEAPGSIDATLPHRLRLEALGSRIRGFVDGQLVFDIADADTSSAGGAVALICEEGRIESGDVTVAPLAGTHETSGPPAHASPGHPLVDAR